MRPRELRYAVTALANGCCSRPISEKRRRKPLLSYDDSKASVLISFGILLSGTDSGSQGSSLHPETTCWTDTQTDPVLLSIPLVKIYLCQSLVAGKCCR